ncbi:glycosyltransferase [Evansella tamaricis]|uniref:Glycosyltransferase n=1 Tax=Evansella tamaricis TaxID=2069301 RepID=A0ABS6JI11_9BACI|nr:glycosyltransferase [Evansella tamaricis]MBU9713309.1 glycosyltransferase [Evansella tamaricis]
MVKGTKKYNLSIIIQAQNEENTIKRIIKELIRLNPHEIIVVINGSTDRTSKIVKGLNCIVLEYESALGINVGKALGAYEATGDILLFLDGDIFIESVQLSQFVKAIMKGYDVVLNNLDWTIFRENHFPTAICKRALNIFLKREDLLVNSLGAIPNAMSKNALDKIGWWNLVDPPLSQTIGITQNLLFTSPEPVDVISSNPFRPKEHKMKARNSPFPNSTSRIIGDHVEALHYLRQLKGFRAGFHDGRNREKLSNIHPLNNVRKNKRSIVITCEGKTRGLLNVIKELQLISDEIIVAGYGLSKRMIKFAKNTGAKVINQEKSLGINASRSIGAARSSGDAIFFTDCNTRINKEEAEPFFEAIENGTEIALTNAEHLITDIIPIDSINTIKYFLNLVCKNPELKNASLYSLPHAIHRRVIEQIGWDKLTIPPLFFIMSEMKGFSIIAEQKIVIKTSHEITTGNIHGSDKYRALEVFLGDHIEALDYYIRHTNKRGGYLDGNKDRKIIRRLKNR